MKILKRARGHIRSAAETLFRWQKTTRLRAIRVLTL